MADWTLKEWLDGARYKPENLTKVYYYQKISRLAMSPFNYESKDLDNLPLIEKYLWLDGRVAIWKHPQLGWIITRCMETGFNVNGWAIRWRPYFDRKPLGIDTPREMGLDDDIVVIYDLPHRMFNSNICCKWIDEIAQTNEIIRMQIFNQRAPLVGIAKDPKQAGKVKKLMVDIAENVKGIILGEDVTGNIKAVTIESPFNISDLQASLKTKEAEMLEFLGIDSQSAFQKKERLITDEQEANDQILSYLLNDRMRARKEGLKRLKEKGVTVTLEETKLTNEDRENADNKDTGLEPDNRR